MWITTKDTYWEATSKGTVTVHGVSLSLEEAKNQYPGLDAYEVTYPPECRDPQPGDVLSLWIYLDRILVIPPPPHIKEQS